MPELIRGTRRQLAENNGMQTAITGRRRIAGVVGVHEILDRESTSIGQWLAEEH